MYSLVEKEVIQKAFNQISEIPSENIITSVFSNDIDKCCVIGHLQRLNSENPSDYSSLNCCDFTENRIRVLSKQFFSDNNFLSIATVNNGGIKAYPQETPKERSLALLADMLKA
tara:strand:- start:14511 stop:14852 length:342 start_codon:yes stop_codon:yes gene_type:complete